MRTFEPRPSLRGGHRMTLYSWGNPRYFPNLPTPVRRYFDVAPDARVVADCHWQARAWERPTLLALHGLNGSSDAHYMKGLAEKAFARGMNAVLLNQRNCGDTEHLCRGALSLGAHCRRGARDRRTADDRPPAGHRRRRLFARREPRVEAGRRIRRVRAAGARRRGGRVADHRNRGMHPGAGTSGQRPLRVEFRQGPEAAHAPQGAVLAGHVRPAHSCARSGPCASSIARSRRRISASPTRTTTITAQAPCASSIASASPRWSSRPKTTRSCRRGPSANRS